MSKSKEGSPNEILRAKNSGVEVAPFGPAVAEERAVGRVSVLPPEDFVSAFLSVEFAADLNIGASAWKWTLDGSI